MQELEHVLDALLHDVRGPLGVVGGYLRLLRDGQGRDPVQAERAIGKAQEALRHVADLCADASGWLPRSHAPAPIDVRVTDFVDAVAAAADGVRFDRTAASSDRRVRLALPLDRVVAAVVALLRVTGRGSDSSVLVRVEGDWLSLGGGAPASHALGEPGEPFDPWQHPGLVVPLARFVVVNAGGACLAEPDDPTRPRVRFALAA